MPEFKRLKLTRHRSLQRRSSLPPCLRQFLRRRLPRGKHVNHSLIGFSDASIARLDGIPLRFEFRKQRRKPVWRHTIFPRGIAQRIKPVLSLFQFLRIEFETRQKGPKLPPRLLRQCERLFKGCLRCRRSLSCLVTHPAETLQCSGNRRFRTLLARQRIDNRGDIFPNTICIHQKGPGRRQCLLLTHCRCEGHQLLHCMMDKICFSFNRSSIPAQRVHRLPRLFQFNEAHSYVCRKVFVPTKIVQQFAMRCGIKQAPIVGLPMNLHQHTAQIA